MNNHSINISSPKPVIITTRKLVEILFTVAIVLSKCTGFPKSMNSAVEVPKMKTQFYVFHFKVSINFCGGFSKHQQWQNSK